MRNRGVRLLLLGLVFIAAFSSVVCFAQAERKSDAYPFATLALKLLIRPTRPAFQPGDSLTFEVACVGIPEIAGPTVQQGWSQACSDIHIFNLEPARSAGYWGVGSHSVWWLENKIHRCLLPAGQSYEAEQNFRYTDPKWVPFVVPAERVAGMQGLVAISVTASLTQGEKHITDEFASAVAVISPPAKDANSPDFRLRIESLDAALAKQDIKAVSATFDAFYAAPSRESLKLAIGKFKGGPLWPLIQDSPFPDFALEEMRQRLTSHELVPDYDLLVDLTAMKLRLDHPLETEASGRQPYTEFHPELEDAGLEYLHGLVNLVVESTERTNTARSRAVAEIIDSISEQGRCPLGTYALRSDEATLLKAKLGQ